MKGQIHVFWLLLMLVFSRRVVKTPAEGKPLFSTPQILHKSFYATGVTMTSLKGRFGT